MRSLGKSEAVCAIHNVDDDDARLWEIAENLHRADLTVLERDEHVAEWMRITENKLTHTVSVSSAGGRGNEGGMRAASRDLGVNREDARRATKVAGLSSEAKQAWGEAGNRGFWRNLR